MTEEEEQQHICPDCGNSIIEYNDRIIYTNRAFLCEGCEKILREICKEANE